MSSKLPYVAQPGIVKKVLEKARDAKTPDRFTVDFLETKLGCRGGNYRQFIPLAKKIGLLNSDGTPTDIYKAFRNPTSSKAAVAEAIKIGYRELFDRNEYAGGANKDEFKGLVVEVTGLDAKDPVFALICRTFDALKSLADFGQKLPKATGVDEADVGAENSGADSTCSRSEGNRDVDLRLSYTINLVLPKTDDPAVFSAIFKSLREHLLRK